MELNFRLILGSEVIAVDRQASYIQEIALSF